MTIKASPSLFSNCLLVLLVAILTACSREDAKSVQSQGASAKPLPAVVSPAAQAALSRLTTPAAPLSVMAELGKKIFFDPTLSGSGKLSCASCHSPEHAYAPGNALAVQPGGVNMKHQGMRAVPSLTYLEHTPRFVVGPDTKPDADEQNEKLTGPVQKNIPTDAKVAGMAKAAMTNNAAAAKVEEVVPQGGMDWDGRAVILAKQAGGPLLDPNEMANKDPESLVAKLKAAPYAKDMTLLFGSSVFTSSKLALAEAYFALARYQFEDRSFHPYDSKFDYFLAGKISLSEQELRGKKLFDDPKKGNCASCHLDKPSKDGQFAPVFTDYQFEALGAPRNQEILANHNSKYFDEGLCGPFRTDMAAQTNYCGLFKTPTLRNAATRHAFFHNGVFHTLEDVIRFYVERETKPEKWYPVDANGKIDKYNDLPVQHRVNVDVQDAPFDRKRNDPPALNENEITDMVAFLKTLNDGFQPDGAKVRATQ